MASELPPFAGLRTPATDVGPVLASVSNAMVRLYKEQFGRGPTKARAHLAQPDVLVVVLEDTLTPAERNLADLGEHERLRESRTFVQYAIRDQFIAIVETALGRRVVSFISGMDTTTDTAAEVFVLAPTETRERGDH